MSNNLHGWLNINKPSGCSSFDLIRMLRRVLKTSVIGHTGTLDPFATGVMQFAIGKATRLIKYVEKGRKTYVFTMKFGYETTTDDLTGEPTVRTDRFPLKSEILSILPNFIGEVQQVPPRYSAVKIQGKRAYLLASRGENFEIKPKNIEIYSIQLLKNIDSEWTFEVQCGRGTYIRSLSRDIARKLGSAAHITELHRASIGDTHSADLINIKSKNYMFFADGDLYKAVQNIDILLKDIPGITLNSEDEIKIRRGQKVKIHYPDNDLIKLYITDNFLGVGQIMNGTIIPKTIIEF